MLGNWSGKLEPARGSESQTRSRFIVASVSLAKSPTADDFIIDCNADDGARTSVIIVQIFELVMLVHMKHFISK